MLKVHSVAIEVVREMSGVIREVAAHDADLARQLRRAVTSVPLNIAEGSGVRGGNRRLRYETALGSAREVWSVLEVAKAVGYCEPSPSLSRNLDRVIGTLVNILFK